MTHVRFSSKGTKIYRSTFCYPPAICDWNTTLNQAGIKNCSQGNFSPLIKYVNEIIGFYANVKVRYVEREEIERFDPQGQSFTNVNTPEDLNEKTWQVA